jgi:hypothetical protein
MAPAVVTSTLHAFADGNSPGHVCPLGSAPNVGEYDLLGINSDTTVSTPSGFTVASSRVNAQGSYLFYRKAIGGESSSVTVITSGNFNCEVSHVRLSGLDAVDVTVSSTVVGSNANTSNAINSGTLATATDSVVVFVALASIGTTANQNTPVWSAGYTGITSFNPRGTGSSGVSGLTGWKYPAGTTAETPSVTWSGDAVLNRDTHLIAFTEAAASGNDAVLAGVLGSITSALTASQSDRATLAGVLGRITSTLTASGPFVPPTPGRAGAGSKPVARASAGTAGSATARKGTVFS